MSRSSWFLRFLLGGLLALPALGTAQPVRTDHVEVELVSERTAWVAGELATVALRLKHAPHWHTYWRNPGDAGLPTQIQWQLPAGFSAGEIQWPVPQRIPVPPLANYGYPDEVFLLVPIQVPRSMVFGAPVLHAHVDWLVCNDVCIPGSAELSLSVPVVQGSATNDPRWVEGFAASRAHQPGEINGLHARAVGNGDAISLRVACAGCFASASNDGAASIQSAYFFSAAPGLIEPSRAQVLRIVDGELELRLPVAVDLTAPRQSFAGVLVTKPALQGLAGVTVASTIEGTLVAGKASDPETEPGLRSPDAAALSLWVALGFALVGGLILNLMPCVFPVIAIKILGFSERAHGSARQLRGQGFAFALGIVVSFALLGATLIGLRDAGMAFGWGFQLQSPWVVAGLEVFFWVLALNLFGLVEVGVAVDTTGERGTDHPLWGAFLSGTLAVIVASPCTAPFMGAALGYALVQDGLHAIGVFLAIAIGMALPYLILSCIPALLRWLPRPGRWLLRLRQILGLPLLATVLWLLWVLAVQVGNEALLLVGAGLVLLGASAAIYGRVQFRDRGKWHALAAFGALTSVVLMALVIEHADSSAISAASANSTTAATSTNAMAGDSAAAAQGSVARANAGSSWAAWSPEVLDEARTAGQPVFVDFTAAWCITCQVNKKLVLEQAAMREAFASHSVRTLRADWTRHDERITQALAALGRDGVPVYVLYRPGQAALLLPELLSSKDVTAALATLR